jgi:hypothetical protein
LVQPLPRFDNQPEEIRLPGGQSGLFRRVCTISGLIAGRAEQCEMPEQCAEPCP